MFKSSVTVLRMPWPSLLPPLVAVAFLLSLVSFGRCDVFSDLGQAIEDTLNAHLLGGLNEQWNNWFPIDREKHFHPGARVTALWANANHLDLFATDSVGGVWSTWWEVGAGWQPWFRIGPESSFAPGATVTALWANANHLDLFISGADGVINSTWWEAAKGWQPWFAIPSDVDFQAGATVSALWANPHHLDLFVSSADGTVWSAWWEAAPGWQPWFVIGPENHFQPGATVTALWANASHLDLFIADGHGSVWSTWWEAAPGWRPWFQIHPETLLHPGATVTAKWSNESHLDLFITSSDGTVYSTWWESQPGWQPWFSIHPEIKFASGAPVTALWADGNHLDLFVTRSDGTVTSAWWEAHSGWERWFYIDPETKFNPGAPVTALWSNSSHLDLFVTAADGGVWSNFFDDTASPDWALLANNGFDGQSMKGTYFFAGNWRCCRGWNDWFPIQPESKRFVPEANPTALWANETHVDLFATDDAGVVWSTWQELGSVPYQPWFEISPEVAFNGNNGVAMPQFQPGAPVTAVWANPNHLDLFVTDELGVAWSTWWEAGPGWQQWFSIRPEQTFTPGAAVTALWANEDHLDLFVMDAAGTVWSTWWQADTGYVPWFSIPAEINLKSGGKVAAVWANQNHLDLFATSLGGSVWTTSWEPAPGYIDWFSIHSEQPVTAGATVTARWANANHLDLFVSDMDGVVWSTWWEAGPGWQSWFQIHPERTFAPGTTVTAQWSNADHLDLFIVDATGVVWTTWWEAAKDWQPWFAIHPERQLQPGATVAATPSSRGQIDLFVTGTDGAIWSTFYPGYPLQQWYEYPQGPNEHVYTIHPSNPQDLGWSESQENRNYAVNEMIEGGVNVIVMSYWGERGTDRWAAWAPMHTSTYAHDELFAAVKDKPILIMPAIESGDATRPCGGNADAFHFASDFPGADDNPAPQLVVQIEDLIHRYIKNDVLGPPNPNFPTWEPYWADKWAQMYDRQGNKRYAINILHVASNQIGPDEHERFARGFDRVAAKVFEDTGILIGFTLDLLPNPTEVNMGGCSKDDKKLVMDTFTPYPPRTGPWLRQQASFLAVQAFIPEVFNGIEDQDDLLEVKRDYLQGWIDQRIPVLLDVDPGYDGHLVFENSKIWGNNDEWRNGQSDLRRLLIKGMVYNTWNGYTEGYAAVPTLEFRDANFRWMQSLFKE